MNYAIVKKFVLEKILNNSGPQVFLPIIIYEQAATHSNEFSVSFCSALLCCVCLMFYAFRWTVFIFLLFPVSYCSMCVDIYGFLKSQFFFLFSLFLFLFYVVLFFALRYVTRQLSLIGFLCWLCERHIETGCYEWDGLRATCRNLTIESRDESFPLIKKWLWMKF